MICISSMGMKHLTFLILLFLPIVLLSCTKQPTRQSPEQQFQLQIAARIEPKVQLQTNSEKFTPQDPIVYRIVNLSQKPIYFQDYAFNLHVYQYDLNEQRWILLNLGLRVNQQLTTVQPGIPNNLENFYGLPPGTIQNTGKLRLVVLGWNNASDPEISKVAAFKDIEVIP